MLKRCLYAAALAAAFLAVPATAQNYPVEWIENSIRRRLAFLRRLGTLRMLGVTIALEHFTAMLADIVDADPEMWEGTPEDIRRLWRWHAMEETEHKAVAFDVFEVVTRDWSPRRRQFFRARIMLFTSFHFVRNVTRYASALLVADGMGRWSARSAVTRFLFGTPGIFRRIGPQWRDWFRLDFHPWNHDNRARLEEMRRQFA